MALTQAYGSGASQNSSQSISNTAGMAASATAQNVAAASNQSAMDAWAAAAQFNAEQAAINREWQERMANTVYQRTVKDMKKAGINPVLAAGMGLASGSVGGGSAASISPAQVFNAQTFPESNSASQSSGSSWNQSESGLMTFLGAMETWVSGMLGAISSSKSIDIAINGLENLFKDENGKTPSENYNDYTSESGSGKYSDYQDKMKSNNKKAVGDNKFLQFLNGLQLKATGLK